MGYREIDEFLDRTERVLAEHAEISAEALRVYAGKDS